MKVNLAKVEPGQTGSLFKWQDERPDWPDLPLGDGGLKAQAQVLLIPSGAVAQGQAEAELVLECHRCLQPFDYRAWARFQAEFNDHPDEEKWPIDGSWVDLDPAVRQEIIVSLPIKQLCSPDCLGLCLICGQKQLAPHKH